MTAPTRRQLLAGGGAALATGLLYRPRPARAAVVIKLASLAPEGSTWHKALQKMGQEWATLSGGQVELKIYAGGVAGNETVMVRKMRIGQLHSAALTNLGLLDIDPSAQVINTPVLIRTYPELDHVMGRMTPEFETRIQAKGFKVLNWADAGWAHLFSKEKITNPDDVGKMKIFAWEGDPAAVEMYKAGGFSPVVVAATDVVPALQSGLIDAFPSTPLGALALQWFGLAPNMLKVPWAPLMGATIVDQKVWDTIPAEFQAPMEAAARRIGTDMKDEIRRQDGKAIEVMKKYGLSVNEVDPATFQRWLDKGSSVYGIVREKVVPADIFDMTKKLVDEYRVAHP